MRCVMRLRCVRSAVVLSSLLWGQRWSSTWNSTPEKYGESAAASGATVLPGVDLARRAVSPNQEFPATWSEDEPLSPSNPRVCWREHYSLDAQKPYYQNIKTMEVTWDIPEGFVTRFPRLYASNGYHVDATGAVFRSSTASEPPANGTVGTTVAKEAGVKAVPLKQRLAAYGAGGLLWYLIVHNISLACVFTCLYVFRIDLIRLARSYGFDVKCSDEVAVSESKRPPFWKTFVLSIVLNKILVPLHLLLTVTSAPLLVHRLEPIATSLFPKIKAFARSFVGRGAAAGTTAKV
ncbi:conserved hypothetical protein [Leishmania infantum JPCM5]|uniref:Protein_of_uncharacterized_function_(DUF1279)_-_p utative n=2 Tax=Leishmania infantum TaxID=5671 RepID=A0A6L0XWJ3_LEIIN|nr:conserved hypothetical protein [Leishmania infantum JPCM5]CAC9523196.1 Protein_of_uncharacterised_function_(DUF1279)_-_putative [Leishmania infantum]CAM70792.1 conserved hypothetical protein [Leishmania infantum JPCM5]SUZ44609.1 Protein_of_uncharacterised_function_(DUF1279)_-_putative [Leishmania infantum]|eukprot:XP_001467727.1 conserved hypothetical protein [Leishmania infantum JPCM5]